MSGKTKTVRNYNLVQKLGSGSFADVYKAVNVLTEEIFAMKSIAREKLGSAKLHENLKSEISIMRDFNHPNIVRLYESFNSERYIYLVLEYCAGGDLQHYIRKTENGRLSEDVARRLLVQLAHGLQFLQSKNIIHRDIKPQNLLLSDTTSSAVIKYADFGFAKHLGEASMAQTQCGTPLYMAPEIFEHKEYDSKADIWSIGCVLHEMLTGLPPYRANNPRELFLKIKSEPLRLPADVMISNDMLIMLQRLLQVVPKHRLSLEYFCIASEKFVPVDEVINVSDSQLGSDLADTSNSNNAGSITTSSGDIEPKDEKVVDPPVGEIKGRLASLILETTSNEQSPIGMESSNNRLRLNSSNMSSPPANSETPNYLHHSSAPSTPHIKQTRNMSDMQQAPGASSNIKPSTSPQSNNYSGRSTSSNASGPSSVTMRSASVTVTPSTATMIVNLAGGGAISNNSPATNPAVYLTPGDNSSNSNGIIQPQSRSRSGQSSTYFDTGDTKPYGYGNIKAEGTNNVINEKAEKDMDGSDDYVILDNSADAGGISIGTDKKSKRSEYGVNAGPPGGGGVGNFSWDTYNNNNNTTSSVNVTGSVDLETNTMVAIKKKCVFVAEIVTVLTSSGDDLVRKGIYLFSSLNDANQEKISKTENSVKLSVSNSSHKSNNNMIEQSNRLFADGLSLYLRCMGILKQIIEEAGSFKASMPSTSRLQMQVGRLLEGLTSRFDQILGRVENTKKYINPDCTFAVVETIMYHKALSLGQEASVQELLGNFKIAFQLYHSAYLLIECVLMTTTDLSDRRVLQGYSDMFNEQCQVCDQNFKSLTSSGIANGMSDTMPAMTASSTLHNNVTGNGNFPNRSNSMSKRPTF